MGRSTKVVINGREFPSKKAAVGHFMDKRETVKEAGPLKEGELFDELRELYLRYCEVTSFDLNGRIIYAFSVDYEPRQNGQTWASHLCYWVHFSPKQSLSFSVREAVDEIAKTAAEQI
ncbi:hypothetical protein C5G84_02140 [Salmonella enterica]|nr:hypothetical protein [Salmonella enterica]EEC2906525.1 hypothetical protein [Salmonella enterica]